jgi:hypothetical protein
MRMVVPLVLALTLLAGCADEQSEIGTAPTQDASPTTAASPVVSPSPGSQARAVYWLGATRDPRGPRLYREFVRRPATADPVRDAVEAMLSLEPSDPDYVSLWADGTTVREVRRDGTTAVVDLSREAATNGGGSGFEAMTLQQLVHTVTAADPSLTAVRLLVEGEPVETLWGSTDASRPVSRAPAIETLGPVWIDLPDGGPLPPEFGGTAAVFEATVTWELRQDDRVVQEGFSTATEGAPGRGEWTGSVEEAADVPPGDYVLWAYESSAKDGSITWLDTKRVTVTS